MLKKIGQIEDKVCYAYFRGDEKMIEMNFRVPPEEKEVDYIRDWFSDFFGRLEKHVLTCEVVNA